MRRSLTLSSLTSFSSEHKTVSYSRKFNSSKKKERHDVSPSEFVIRNILNYSRALAVVQTKETGNMRMIMN
jgi:hypothetical protein